MLGEQPNQGTTQVVIVIYYKNAVKSCTSGG
jgi:hypothetical protein